MIDASSTLTSYPSSKIAKENFEVFGDAWASHINDLSVLVKDVNDVCQGKPDRTVYLSLPRPGVSRNTPILAASSTLYPVFLQLSPNKHPTPCRPASPVSSVHATTSLAGYTHDASASLVLRLFPTFIFELYLCTLLLVAVGVTRSVCILF